MTQQQSFEISKNDFFTNALMSDLAYSLYDCKTAALLSNSTDYKILEKAGWRILCTSQDNSKTKHAGYNAVALINNDNQVVLASAGTIIDSSNLSQSFYDTMDDTLILLHKTPEKIYSCKAFVNLVIDQLKQQHIDVDTCQFSTTGHSLGAVLSDLLAFDIKSRGYEVKSSITFDNPGSKPIIKDAIAKGYFTHQTNIDKGSTLFEIYNAQPNLINTTNTQFGNSHVGEKLSTHFDNFLSSQFMFYDMISGLRSHLLSNVVESFQHHFDHDNNDDLRTPNQAKDDLHCLGNHLDGD